MTKKYQYLFNEIPVLKSVILHLQLLLLLLLLLLMLLFTSR